MPWREILLGPMSAAWQHNRRKRWNKYRLPGNGLFKHGGNEVALANVSGPSPCSATCKRMPFVSIVRCVTWGIAEATQDVSSGPAGLGGSGLKPTVSAPPPGACRVEKPSRLALCCCLIVARLAPRRLRGSRFASGIYDCFPRATIRCNVDGL